MMKTVFLKVAVMLFTCWTVGTSLNIAPQKSETMVSTDFHTEGSVFFDCCPNKTANYKSPLADKVSVAEKELNEKISKSKQILKQKIKAKQQ
jgi:hypothetical protein